MRKKLAKKNQEIRATIITVEIAKTVRIVQRVVTIINVAITINAKAIQIRMPIMRQLQKKYMKHASSFPLVLNDGVRVNTDRAVVWNV